MKEELLATWRELMEQGTKYLGQRKYSEAEKYFLRSVQVAKQLAVSEIMAFTLRLLATSRIKQGKIKAAEKGFREALSICEKLQNFKGMSEAWAGLASVAVANGDLTGAVKCYIRAIEIYPPTSPQLRLGMLYSDLGQVYAALENWRKAKQAYISAKEMCRIHGYPTGEGQLDMLLAEVSYRQGEKISAKEWLIHACQIFGTIRDEISLANSLQFLAFIYFDLKELDFAMDCQQRAVALILRHQQLDEASESCYFLAKIFQVFGNLDEAQYYLELSLKLYTQRDLGLAMRYQSLGRILLLKMDFLGAEEYLSEAAILFEEYQEDIKLGEIYEILAFLAESQGREDEAAKYRIKSVNRLADQVTLDTMLKLAQYYEKRHGYLDALNYYWQSLQIAREIGLETKDIERAVQRISNRLRKKSKR